jgi:pyruvate, water dikinase
MENKPILKGIAASGGTASGPVKLINNSDDLKQVKLGDIIVTEFTDPSYVSAMIKANGFITNIGGLGSHAGIIARELGVPCIVGTGNATTLLKDGVEVIIDGDKGLVFKKP